MAGLTLAAALLIGPLHAADAGADQPGRADCSGQSGAAAYQRCLEERSRMLGESIRAAEQRILMAISSAADSRYRRDAQALFDASRQTFRAQRTATCEVAASMNWGADTATVRRLRCQEKMDLDWLAHLDYLAHEVEAGR